MKWPELLSLSAIIITQISLCGSSRGDNPRAEVRFKWDNVYKISNMKLYVYVILLTWSHLNTCTLSSCNACCFSPSAHTVLMCPKLISSLPLHPLMLSTNSSWIYLCVLRMVAIINTVRKSPCSKRISNAVQLSQLHHEIKAVAAKCDIGVGAGRHGFILSSAIASWVGQIHSPPKSPCSWLWETHIQGRLQQVPVLPSGSLLGLTTGGAWRQREEASRITSFLSHDLGPTVSYNLKFLLLSKWPSRQFSPSLLFLVLRVVTLLLTSPGILHYPLWLPISFWMTLY